MLNCLTIVFCDSGATHHMRNDQNKFLSLRKGDVPDIVTVIGENYTSNSPGHIEIKVKVKNSIIELDCGVGARAKIKPLAYKTAGSRKSVELVHS